MNPEKYIVMVDDNFHYMDTSERYKHGEFMTIDEAIEACKKIVEASIQFENGMTITDLLANYSMFGDDPFIIGYEGFSARKYAKEYCEKLIENSNGQSS